MKDEKLIERLRGLVSEHTGLGIRSQDTPLLIGAQGAHETPLFDITRRISEISGRIDAARCLRRLPKSGEVCSDIKGYRK